MFDNLSDALNNTFKKLAGKAVLSESNIKEAMEQIRYALLEADVNYDIVEKFIEEVTPKCLGEKVLKSIKPSEQVIKVVNDYLVELMGSAQSELNLADNQLTIIMMVGLHGAGKTTTTAKLARYLTADKKQKVLMGACDVYRPAAIDQLEALGSQLNLEVFSKRNFPDVLTIAQEAKKKAQEIGANTLILDMAGRLQIDQDMVQELVRVRDLLKPQEILLTADSALGQEAVSVAKHFNDALNISGIILTKLDGDARGGAALSMYHTTTKPIKFTTSGEKPEDLDVFYPDRMASRILDMGDVVSLVEQASKHLDEEQMEKLEKKIKKQTFDLNDFLKQMQQLKKMGGITKMLGFIPGAKALKDQINIDDSQLVKIRGMIHSMTTQERENPTLINQSRMMRIAKGSGTTTKAIGDLIKRFMQSRKMMSTFSKNNMSPESLLGGNNLGNMPSLPPSMPGIPGTKATQAKMISSKKKKKKNKAAKKARKKNR